MSEDPHFDLAKIMLPGNTHKFHVASLASMLSAMHVDIEAIQRESDWRTASVKNLPLLAFDRGIRFWNDDWPEETKRWVVRHGWTLARLQGTPLGIEIFINLAGGYVIKEYLPPGGGHFLKQIPYDREAVAAVMPQVRVYHRWPAEYKPRILFWGHGYFGRNFLGVHRGQFKGGYPVLYDRGVETPLGEGEFLVDGNKAYIYRREKRGHATYFGDAYWGHTYLAKPATAKPYAIDIAEGTQRMTNPVPPYRNALFFGRGFWGYSCFVKDSRELDDYDRIILWDKTRMSGRAIRHNSAFFLGQTRFKQPKFTIDLEVKLPGYPKKRPKRWGYFGQMPLINYRSDDLRFMMRGIEAARRIGDKVLVKFVGAKQPRAADMPNLDMETAT